ncbi:protein phosphatase CheZ [Alkalimarinus alittae]|uniref:Protein phosphatase CheZ n=1 Tax=Alkalimarinus alittae TaxID=2961619 RepID=A0ABY6MYS4_9ALTE|nr:protein phosphatase CheZ [Alkalimarinus alittae]UZE94937.1 protein phosphatase CheZ [Alkalimarinus alittae]
MTNKEENTQYTPEFEAQLKRQASDLKDLVDAGNITEAIKVVAELNSTRDQSLYKEVGRLTRTLHESIRNFHLDSAADTNQDELSKIDDATDRLSYVVDMTNKAANKTLDLVEESMPIASEMKQEADILKGDWSKLRRREMKPEEFRLLYKRMDLFLNKLSQQSDQVYRNLSEILLAQDFQDLTGQVIKRVTGLVQEVEENLVNLVAMAGKVDQITGTVHEWLEQKEENNIERGEGPQMNAEERIDVVSSQDDVDDLLSSLGF